MSSGKLVIVTGANRGIGKAICDLILEDKTIKPLTMYATSRKGEDLEFTSSQGRTLIYPKLDIASASSVASFASSIKAEGQAVDVLINNAGVNLDNDFSCTNAKKTLNTNYRGTLEMCKAFIPLLSENGRIVNLSSVGSSLRTWSPELGKQMRSISSLDELDRMIQLYLQHVEAGTDAEMGFPLKRSYSVSKAAINSLTSILAKENPGLTINCCCPGWINTEMGGLVASGRTRPPKSPEEGAKIPVKLAIRDIGHVTGRYWSNDNVRSKDDGKPQEW